MDDVQAGKQTSVLPHYSATWGRFELGVNEGERVLGENRKTSHKVIPVP